jgi:hypothetical protein
VGARSGPEVRIGYAKQGCAAPDKRERHLATFHDVSRLTLQAAGRLILWFIAVSTVANCVALICTVSAALKTDVALIGGMVYSLLYIGSTPS